MVMLPRLNVIAIQYALANPRYAPGSCGSAATACWNVSIARSRSRLYSSSAARERRISDWRLAIAGVGKITAASNANAAEARSDPRLARLMDASLTSLRRLRALVPSAYNCAFRFRFSIYPQPLQEGVRRWKRR